VFSLVDGNETEPFRVSPIMNDKPKELTRAELHSLVWSIPISRLAEQFGITGTGLAKICRRFDIPYPPAGWWTKKAFGSATDVVPLPPAPPETPELVSVSPTPSEAGTLRASVREKQSELGEITVPERLTRPHWLIAGWLEDRKHQLEQARHERDPWRRSLQSTKGFTEQERRRHRILHALFRALEAEGATVDKNQRGQLAINISGEEIEFSLQEKLRQVTRAMTAKEREWESWNKSGVKTELEPTGYFQFSIKAWLDQPIRKNWLESDRRPIEGLIAEIAATFLVLGPALAERRRIREEQAKLFREQQRLLELERERRKQDENRWKRFLEIAQASEQAELARQFIERLRKLEFDEATEIEGMTVSEWLDWAETRAREFDPAKQGLDRIFADIAKVKSWTYQH
jgi:hypothetical protein